MISKQLIKKFTKLLGLAKEAIKGDKEKDLNENIMVERVMQNGKDKKGGKAAAECKRKITIKVKGLVWTAHWDSFGIAATFPA